MEYRLNKIDMELRERINETTSEKRIHRKDQVQTIRDRKRDKNAGGGKKKKFIVPDMKMSNSKIFVTAVKQEKTSIDVEAFNENDKLPSTDVGNFLDVRK
ncbi:hypothetical protein [Clostridium akagii]|uniref:hypothetical protein n=1 Tax=Clostridium akagii TaxID=91623 RepID=UPI00047B366F|nr:hypothetical protein [Clostridium akagii]